MRGRIRSDRGLLGRMFLTAGLLAGIYAGFVWAFRFAGLPWWAVAVVVCSTFAIQYLTCESIVRAGLRIRPLSAAEAARVRPVLERLAMALNVPQPRVSSCAATGLNAFVFGRSPRRAHLVLTSDLIERLEPEELEGVVAHEMAHLFHRDLFVLTVASFLCALAEFVVRGVAHGLDFFDFDLEGWWLILPMLVIIGASLIVYPFARVMVLALSRHRELLADRTAARITGKPSTLASALLKATSARAPGTDLRNASVLCIVSSGKGGWLSTHPRLHVRLERLAAMQRELEAR